MRIGLARLLTVWRLRKQADQPVHERGLRPEQVLVRRSTLEDVFLRLTGRGLIE